MLVLALAILSGFVLLIVCVLFYYSPGKPQLITDVNGKKIEGSISDKVFVSIGGVKQGMFIRSQNLNNPVLLFIHGGPAFPEYFLFEKYKAGLEENFTVCYWEQRGGGLSYSPDIPLASLTFEQLTADAIEVSSYLCNRFGKEKIYLMAHSGGTVIGIQAVAKAPWLYFAYIGVGQITQQAASEKIAYQYMLDQYTAKANKKALKELNSYPLLKFDTCIKKFYKSSLRDNAMHELGIGTMRNMKSVFWGVFIPVFACKAYTISEKMNIWRSKFTLNKKAKFIDQLFVLDIPSLVPTLSIPVYFFSGKYDLTVNVNLSKAYLNQLQAPIKGFYTFERSAHSPIFEEPKRVKQIIESDILKAHTSLADSD